MTEKDAYQKAMIAATLLAPTLSAAQTNRLHSNGLNEVFRSALQRATDLLKLAESPTPRMIEAYQLFTPNEYNLSPEAIANRFKAGGWPKMGSAPTVRKLLRTIFEGAYESLGELIKKRQDIAEYDEDRPALSGTDCQLIAECRELAVRHVEENKLADDPEKIGDFVWSLCSRLLGKRDHFDRLDQLYSREFDDPYLAFLVSRCVPSSDNHGYFPYELLLYASAYQPGLIPAVPSWQLNPQVQLSDLLQERLSPEARLQDIWQKLPVPPQYFLESIVIRIGRAGIDLSGKTVLVPSEASGPPDSGEERAQGLGEQ